MPGPNGLVFWIVAGGIAGWLAGIITRSGKRMGCLLNIVVGILGAVIGGYVFDRLEWVRPGNGQFWANVFMAFVGATILLVLLRLLSRRS